MLSARSVQQADTVMCQGKSLSVRRVTFAPLVVTVLVVQASLFALLVITALWALPPLSLALLVVTVLIRLPSLVALPADGAAVLALPLIRSALHALQAHTVMSQGRIIPALVALPPAQQARMVVPLARQIPLLAVSLARKAIIAAVERISSLALLVVGATAMDCQ